MRTLNETQCITLLEATKADRAFLAARMAGSIDARTAGWLAHEVQNKNLNVTTLLDRAGTKLGAIWWWFSPTNKSLVLNAGASFVKTDTTPAFLQAYELLAKQCGAVSMEFQTARAGVVRIYQRAGWTVEGVAMRKFL
jgi:hypothetical protein